MAQLLNNLPVGAKVKFGKYSVGSGAAQPIIWLIVAKNHTSIPAYPTNSVTLLTEKLIDSLALDAKEPSNANTNIVNHGNADYKYSNIDQWLNKDSSSGNWYVSAHSADQSPTNEYVGDGRGYVSKAGFLNAFSTYEKNAILDTTIRCRNTSLSGTTDVVRKVFLPSTLEIGLATLNFGEGAVWEYFNVPDSYENLGHWICSMTPNLYNDTTLASKPTSISAGYRWWSRSCYGAHNTWYIMGDGTRTGYSSYLHAGVRPALNLSTSAKVSDTTDSDGCYTFIWNSPPNKPTLVNTPTTIYGGKTNTISWGATTDPEGDSITYQLECSVNGGAYTQIYRGSATSYVHLVPFGTSTVVYRVKATDPSGESSAYTTSNTLTVVNNNAPVISGVDSNLGVKDSGFTGTYTVTDANNDAVTVTESIDGVAIHTLVATLGEEITYGIEGTTWLALANGVHTFTIRATDGVDTSVRTYTFTKLVETLSITSSIMDASTMPTRIMIVVTRNVPSGSTFTVEVCNNAYSVEPVWEDATYFVENGLVYSFYNTATGGAPWGVQIRVTVARNGATGACYISAIGGNFE